MSTAPVLSNPPYEALMALPEHLTGEILHGQLHTQPRPSIPHAIAERGLSIDIGGPFDFGRGGPGGWWIIPEPEVHLVRDNTVVVPDLAGWQRERMPVLPDNHRIEIVPDWVCEILSPSTAKKDRALKMPLYAQYGVKHIWLVDPQLHTLEAFALHETMWVLIATLQEDDPVCVAPFAAITFSLADLWA